MACTAMAAGVDRAEVLLTACWSARGLRALDVGHADAWLALQRVRAAPDNVEVQARARHLLTIYVKVTALPVETGGFGAEHVLDGGQP